MQQGLQSNRSYLKPSLYLLKLDLILKEATHRLINSINTLV